MRTPAVVKRERTERFHPRLQAVRPGYRLTLEDGSVIFQWFYPHHILPLLPQLGNQNARNQ